MLYALVQGAEDGWTRPHILLPLVLGVLFLAAFVVVERRVAAPLLDLDVFRNRAFSIASVVTVVGMVAFLGSCFSFSIWLGAVQHQAPARVGIPLLLIQAPAFLLIPVVSQLLTRVSARWLLTAGFFLMAVGAWLASRLDVLDTDLGPMVAPALLIGVGFALSVSSFTAVAINTVPLHMAGMASATTNLLRDLGFALGPIIVGAVALSTAGERLGAALATADLPPDQAGAANGVFQAGGPLAVNGLPPEAPGAAAHELALTALGDGFSTAFLVCAIAALVAGLLTLFGLSGVRRDGQQPTAEALHDPLHPELPGETEDPAAPHDSQARGGPPQPARAEQGGGGGKIAHHQLDLAGNQVVIGDRLAPVRHVLDFDAGRIGEVFSRQMHLAAHAGGAKIERARRVLGQRDQFLHAFHRRTIRHHQQHRPAGHIRDWHQVLFGIEGHARVDVRIDRDAARGHQQRVAVGR